MPDIFASVLEALQLSERLKCELRHSWLSDGRQESVAEHCWQMSFMAILIFPHLQQKPDLVRVLKMAIVHDLVEALVGDVPYFEEGERKEAKAKREECAIGELRRRLPAPSGAEVEALWREFEERNTLEAKFVKALDTLEVQLQHNLASLDSWLEIEKELVYTKLDGPCSYDPFLQGLCGSIKQQAEDKLLAGGVDAASLRKLVEEKRH